MGSLSYSEKGVAYARSVVSGEIAACKWVKAACQRHIDDLERFADPGGAFYFDEAAAEHVCRFVELLPHIKGVWARRKEKVKLEPWQIFILICLFGWKRADGLRRFRTAYIEVPRKNGKSFFAAAVGLYLLAADEESGSEVYSAATTRDQAKIIFETAKAMVRKEPGLQQYFGVQPMAHAITVADQDSTFKALSADADTLEGLNPHCGLVDELHAHKTREVWDVLEVAMGARSQPLLMAITTAGSNRAGICYEVRGDLCKVLNAVLQRHDGLGYRIDGDAAEDDSIFGLIYTIDEPDDWTTEDAWRKANPNFGVSVNASDMARLARKAMRLASAQPNFLTKRLNVWVNADAAWMDMRAWERGGDAKMQAEEFRGWDAYIGLDLASKRDIASMILILQNGSEYRLFGKHYLPEDAVEDSGNSQYAGWAESGFLTETDGNTTDYEDIESDLREWVEAFGVKVVAFDPGFAWDFCQRMKTAGLPMMEYRATVLNYSEPMKAFEAAVLSGKMKHDANPAMTWMVSNVVCHRDKKDNIYPVKERFESKIDGAVAAIAALGVATIAQPQAEAEMFVV